MTLPYDPPDPELIQGCLERRPGYWDLFVERYGRLVRWAVMRTLSRAGGAMAERLGADVFQEVFRRLLEKEELHKLRSSGSLRTYLVVLATRTALDALRSSIRQERRNPDPPERPQGDAGLAPEASAAVLDAERSAVMRELLEMLPYRERACLELHFVHERTHREIALILGIPQDTVSTVIRRTRERLQQLLRKKGFDC